MTELEFDIAFDAGNLDEDYMDFISKNAECPIPNGDVLLGLVESLYMIDEYRDSRVGDFA